MGLEVLPEVLSTKHKISLFSHKSVNTPHITPDSLYVLLDTNGWIYPKGYSLDHCIFNLSLSAEKARVTINGSSHV